MAQQEEGWPLGLQPLNVRIGLARIGEFSGSISFNTVLTGSPSSSSGSSSDLDTESTGSFFHDKSITLGSLIGVSSIIELSGRSVKGRRGESKIRGKGRYKSRTWFFSLCSRASADGENAKSPPSLGHFLAVERRAANNEHRRNHGHGGTIIYGPDELALAQPIAEPNSLFVDGEIAPPPHPSSSWSGSDAAAADDDGGGQSRALVNGSGLGVPVLFTCMCGQSPC